MLDHTEQNLATAQPELSQEQPVTDGFFETPAAAEPAPEHNGTPTNGEAANPRIEAGRKGAKRFHELVNLGRLYEQEHGLTRGRQRLRQLVEEGRLYEQEHGLVPVRSRKRGSRVSKEQVVRRLLDSLVRIAKPAYRPHLARLVRALELDAE